MTRGKRIARFVTRIHVSCDADRKDAHTPHAPHARNFSRVLIDVHRSHISQANARLADPLLALFMRI